MKNWIIPALLVLVNFIYKGLFLAANSVAGDEPFSIYHAQMDLGPLLDFLATGNNPPLYEVFMHFWIEIVGISEFSVRFPSLVFSSITILFIYQLANRHLNQRVGIIAGVVFIFSNYHILFAQEARVYALLGMLSVMSMYYFLEILYPKEQGIQKKKIFSLILINTLIIYAHYFGFFILLVQLLYFLSQKESLRRHGKTLIVITAAVFFLYIPHLITFFERIQDYSTLEGYWLTHPKGFESLYNMIWNFSNIPFVAVVCITVLIFGLIKAFSKRKTLKLQPAASLIIFWFSFIFIFVFLISFQVPMFLDRYMMPASIAFVFLA
jgi:mannosyltransferase